MDKSTAQHTLELFCSLPIGSSEDVFRLFATLPRAEYHFDGEFRNFVYVPGTREDRVLLAAHADTVWHYGYNGEEYTQTLKKETFDGKTVYLGANGTAGIGADDRAGCAILWLLRNSGHSLLLLDGEEQGQIGAHHIRDNYPALFDELNRHAYAIQFDRRNATDYKVYNLPVTKKFTKFIQAATGYTDAGKLSRTDIVVLCRDVCGVNLSVGYHEEHSSEEYLVFEEWFHTLCVAEKLLTPPQERYPRAQ